MVDALRQDVRRATRRLLRTPGFTAIALVTLALGIGANTAIFSAIHAVLLRPLPYPEPERLVQLYSTVDGDPATVSPPDFVDWRREERLFESAAAWFPFTAALGTDQGAVRLDGPMVTPELFRVLRVSALHGRTLHSADTTSDAPPVTVLAYATWRRHFGGDPGVVGRSIRINGSSYQVVGVMPAHFAYPANAELWLPLAFTPDDLQTQRGAHYLSVIARLAPGVSLAEARAGLAVVASRLAIAYPESNRNYGASAMSLHEWTVGEVRPALLVLLGAVAVVLLVACVNVANLLLARSFGREREIAIRLSLGASRWRIVRELAVESLVLAIAGAGAGLLLATWGVDALAALRGAEIPRLSGVRIDGTVVGFAGTIAIGCALLFGSLPALHVLRRQDITQALKDGAPSVLGGRGGWRLRRALVIGEVMLAVVLLAGAGLLIRSFIELHRVEPGFDPRGLHTFEVSLPSSQYDPARRRAFYRELLTRVDAIPGTDEVAAVFGLPMTDFHYGISINSIDGRPLESDEGDRLSVQIRVATPGYFHAMRIPLLRGREFTEADREGAPPVLIATESAARRLWPGVDPLGHRVALGTRFGLGGDRAGGTVVGIVPDVHDIGPATATRPIVWVAHAQFPLDDMDIVIRTAREPEALVPALREIIRDLDPDVPLDAVRPMTAVAADTVVQPRLYMLLLGLFAATATLLAAVGIYGVIAQLVAQRRREIGIRIALGARAADVLRLVGGQGLAMVAVGLAMGVVASLVATRLVRGLLFGVEPTDPTTLLAVAVVLLVAAAAACWIPARRATRLDPIAALRTE